MHEMSDGYPYLHRPEIKMCKLSKHPRSLVLKLGNKIKPKQNALSGFNLLSRDSESRISYEIQEEEEVYLHIQKALKPTRIQTIICTYMVMAGTVLICIK